MQHMEACELREKSKKIFIPEQKVYFKKIKNNKKFGICHIFGAVAPHQRVTLHKNKFTDYL